MAYRIRDWNLHYENNRTRELKKLDWVPLPNSLDSDGFVTLMRHRHGLAHFGAWIIILQIASKGHPRGTLTRSNGSQHDAESLSKLGRTSVEVMSTALLRLVEVGWIESYEILSVRSVIEKARVNVEIPHPPAEIPHPPATSRARVPEGKGREGKEEAPLCPTDVGPVADFELAPVPVNGNGKPRDHHKAQEEWFAEWWAIYWRKVSRKDAEKAFYAKVKSLDRHEEVMRATKAQTAAMMARDPDHRPHGATWLNAERWKDEPSTPAKTGPGKAGSFTESVTRAMERRVNAGLEPM